MKKIAILLLAVALFASTGTVVHATDNDVGVFPKIEKSYTDYQIKNDVSIAYDLAVPTASFLHEMYSLPPDLGLTPEIPSEGSPKSRTAKRIKRFDQLE